jgi:hypothetical protein
MTTTRDINGLEVEIGPNRAYSCMAPAGVLRPEFLL